MTQTELEQLSRDVAKKRGCEPKSYITQVRERPPRSKQQYTTIKPVQVWLYQDSAFCFELMVSEKIWHGIDENNIYVEAKTYTHVSAKISREHIFDFQDANEATRVAILRAYLAKGE